MKRSMGWVGYEGWGQACHVKRDLDDVKCSGGEEVPVVL